MNYLNTALSSVNALGEGFDYANQRKRQEEQDAILARKTSQESSDWQLRRKELQEGKDKTQALIAEIQRLQGEMQPSPEQQKESATQAEIDNYDAIHSAATPEARRTLGKQVEAQGSASAEPDYGKLSLKASSRLSPLMIGAGAKESDIPLLGTLSDRSKIQAQERMSKNRSDSPGLSGWRDRSRDWDAISAMPDGPEKDTAKESYLYKWAPSVGYGASPESIEQAKKKSVAVGTAEIPVKAKTSYATTTATEQAQRDIQKNNPMLTGEGAIKVSQSAMAIKNLERLKEELEKGNINYFDIVKKTGQFANPKVNNAYQQVSEIVGRQQSGAAIANHEWSNFGKEILNKNFLLTPEGKSTALENINDYLDRFHSVGILQTSDEDWYNKYNERARSARSKNSSQSPTTTSQTKVINGITYKKVPGGWEPQ
jgi:hypothetical protein